MYKTIIQLVILWGALALTTNAAAQSHETKVDYPYSIPDLTVDKVPLADGVVNDISTTLLFINDSLFKNVHRLAIGEYYYKLPQSWKQKPIIHLQLRDYFDEIELLDSNYNVLASCDINTNGYSLTWFEDNYSTVLKQYEELKVNGKYQNDKGCFQFDNIVLERNVGFESQKKFTYIDKDGDGNVEIIKTEEIKPTRKVETEPDKSETEIKEKIQKVNFPTYEACLSIDLVPNDPRIPFAIPDILMFENDTLFSNVRWLEIGSNLFAIPLDCLTHPLLQFELMDGAKCVYLLDTNKCALAACYPNESSFKIQWFANGKNSQVIQHEKVIVGIEYLQDMQQEHLMVTYDNPIMVRHIGRTGKPDEFELQITYSDENGVGESE